MKGLKAYISMILLFCMCTYSWALKTKFDPTIFINELRPAGINVIKVQKNLGLSKDQTNQELIVKHVITTGRNQADKNHMIVSIDTLEKIQPTFSAYRILLRGTQTALSNEQVKSLMENLDTTDSNKWIMNPRQKKFINIVLMKKDESDNKISPLTTSEARTLVKWAIKNKRLDREDHGKEMLGTQ